MPGFTIFAPFFSFDLSLFFILLNIQRNRHKSESKTWTGAFQYIFIYIEINNKKNQKHTAAVLHLSLVAIYVFRLNFSSLRNDDDNKMNEEKKRENKSELWLVELMTPFDGT